MFSPPPATLRKAIANGQLTSFPGLTTALLKSLPPSTATAKGHMHRTRKNIRSTSANPTCTPDARLDDSDMYPAQHLFAAHALDAFCFAALADKNTGTIYTDLPGEFPVRSIRNMRYIFVCYAYQPNAILVRPMTSRNSESMVAAYEDIYTYLTAKGFKPNLNIIDNEASKAVQNFIESNDTEWQLVEPDNHRVNAAERAIQTFKNHFIAGLCTVDPLFPIQCWCYLLQQAEITLNLLCTARSDPSKSA